MNTASLVCPGSSDTAHRHCVKSNHDNTEPNQSRPPSGRPALRVGEVGKISTSKVGDRFRADAKTRDVTGRVRRVRGSGATAAEAEAVVRQKAATLGLSPDNLSGASTLGELLNVWLSEIVAHRNIRPQTALMYRTKANRLTRLYGGIEVADLRPRRVQTIVNDLAQNMKASEFQSLKGVLNQALRYAVRAELLDSNPLAVLEPARPARKGPPVALTVEQVQAFRRSFAAYVEEGKRESNREKARLTVDIILGLGGLRIGEALAIRYVDVDFEQSTATVSGTVIYVAGEPLFRQPWPKHDSQTRTVQLTEQGIGMSALRSARDLCAPSEREPEMPVLRRVETRGIDHAWINPAVVTHHFGAVRQRPEMVAVLAETGLTASQLTPHTLRRSVATVITREIGLELASELLGHADSRITKQSYVAPMAKRVASSAVDELFRVFAETDT